MQDVYGDEQLFLCFLLRKAKNNKEENDMWIHEMLKPGSSLTAEIFDPESDGQC